MENKFTCELCSKPFKHHGTYQKHLRRLTPCIPFSGQAMTLFHPNGVQNLHASIPDEQCSYCLKMFTTKAHKVRHEKTTECQKQSTALNMLKEEIKSVQALKQDVAELKQKACEVVVVPSQAVSVKGNNNSTTTTYNIQNNFVMNKRGEEDMSHLTTAQKLNIVSRSFGAVLELIQIKHFDKSHPENSNIYLANYKLSSTHYYDGVEWVMTTNTELIRTLYDDNFSNLVSIYDEIRHLLKPAHREQFEKYKKAYSAEDIEDDRIKDDYKNIKMLLYNKREQVIELRKIMKTIR